MTATWMMAQVKYLLLVEIDDAARGADQDVCPLLKLPSLLVIVHAAEHDGELEARIFADAQCIRVNLHRQFARRRDDDGARRILRTALGSGLRQQPIEQCDEKGGGLAGAGLCLTRNVVAGQRHRQSLCLNGGATGVTQFGNAPLQGFGDVEGFER